MLLQLVLLVCMHVSSSFGQFPVFDGVNDLFALFTQCPITPQTPPENQYFCYRTRTVTFAGFTLCNPVFVRQRRISIADRADTHTVYYLNTPGRLRGANYVNRLLCRWNIKCPTGQLMYFDYPEHDIQQAVNSPYFVNPVCLDYLKVSRDFGNFISCGTEPPEGDLEPSRLLVEFRSNRSVRRPGFRMRVICFDPLTQDGQGCTTFASNTKRETKQRPIPKETTSPLFQEIINKLEREKRVSYATPRFIQKAIDPDAHVVFAFNTVTVILKGVSVISFPDVKSFHSFNEFAGVQSYYNIGNKTVTFPGFGVLIIVDNAAYYVIYGVDSRFLPNPTEQQMIRELLDAGEVIVVDEEFIIEEEDNLGQTGTPGNWKKRSTDDQSQSSHEPKKRNVSGQQNTSTLFPPAVFAMAQSAENSCNAVLKAVAETILNNA